MGWTTHIGATKEELLASRIRKQDTETKTWECLAHSLRGSVLWTVWETTEKATGAQWRFIGCDVIGSDRGHGWGYKDMCESMGPYYYNCPLSFLDMTPTADANWRAEVRNYHAKQSAQRAERKANPLAVGQVVKLTDASRVPFVEIVSLKPLLGAFNGTTYRVPKRLIADAEAQAEFRQSERIGAAA